MSRFSRLRRGAITILCGALCYGTPLHADEPTPPPEVATKPTAAATPEQLQEWFEIGARWQVGTEEYKQAITDARASLIAQGKPALEFALTKIDTVDGLTLRCVSAVVLGLKDIALEPLLEKLKEDHPVAQANILGLLGDLQDVRAIEAVLPYVHHENGRLSNAAIGALTQLNAVQVAPVFIEALRDPQRTRGKVALMLGLAKFKATTAIPALLEQLDAEFYSLRYTAQQALQSMGNDAFQVVAAEIKAGQAPWRRLNHLLLILGASAAEADADIVATALTHADASVRGHVYQALAEQYSPHRLELLQQHLPVNDQPFVLDQYTQALAALQAKAQAK